MPANINPISAVTESGLGWIELLKDELRKLKEEAYGSGCNEYREEHKGKQLKENWRLPSNIDVKQLETMIDELISPISIELAKEFTETRVKIEDGLGLQVERLMPIWLPEDALVRYSLRVEGRNKAEMVARKEENRNAGYTKEDTTIATLRAREWPSAWRDIIVWDRKVDSREIAKYMPKNADYLLSTVHKFEVVEEKAAGKNGRKNNGNGKDLSEDYVRVSDAEGLHWRVKSGPEKLWKVVLYLTGLEEKPGKTREEIVDDAGIRLLCSDKHLGRKFVGVFNELGKGLYFPDLTGAIILQKLPSKDQRYNHKKAFLGSIQKGYREFCGYIMEEEIRDIEITKTGILPYYIEMLTFFGKNKANIFDRNVINTLLYANNTFDAMYEQGYDQFAYKVRNEGWRTDHYTLFEWLVAKKVAPIIMTGNSLQYANDVTEVRMRQSGLLPKLKRKAFSPSARS